MDFARHMKLFLTTVESPGVSARQKVQELQHYFDGAAYTLVESEVLRDDAEAAFNSAVDKLKRKFDARRETALEMLEEALSGKPVAEKDINGLLVFYTELSSAYELAETTGRALDFSTKSTIDTVLRKKLPHLTAKWFKKFIKFRKTNATDLGFSEFLDFIDDEHRLAEMYLRVMGSNTASNNGGKTPLVGAKVAATSASTSGKPGGAATTAGRCAACGAGHALTECSTFRDADADAKRKACALARVCYRCLEGGHIARDCKAEIRCATCQRSHHTWAHTIQREGGAANDAGGASA